MSIMSRRRIKNKKIKVNKINPTEDIKDEKPEQKIKRSYKKKEKQQQ
jgi:hypothetical protein